MKKFKFLFAIFAMMMALVACEKPFDPNEDKPGTGGTTTETNYGKGTEAEPYTVAGVVKAATGDAWVKGIIVGFMQTGDTNYPVFTAETDSINTNILLADSIGDEVNYIAVQLPKGDVRNALNLAENKDNLNKEVLLYGTIAPYFGSTGLKGVSYAKLGDAEFGNKPADANDVIFTQSFKQSFGEFTEYSVSGDEKWYIDTKYGYAMITGYVSATKENHANEDWLISPAISLEGVAEAKMNIEHVLRYASNPANDATIWVSEDYTTGDPTAATWTKLDTKFANAADWTLEMSKDIDLMPYVGKTIRVALKYVATAQKAGTWEVKTLNVLKGKAEVGGGDDPVEGEGGSETQPYTVAQAISHQGDKDNGNFVWAEGFIVGVYGNNKAPIYGADALTAEQPYNVLIADAADDYNTTLCVQLPAGVIRDGVNLQTNGKNLGKKLKIQATLEAYNSMPGAKNAKVAYLDGVKVEAGALDTDGKILAESLMSQASFDKFITYSVKGAQEWSFDEKYGAKMSGYVTDDKRSYENEDWFITPALNLEGKTEVKIKFDHARGPEASMNVGVTEGWYAVLISNDYTEGDPTAATWTEIEGVNHGTTKWSYVSSGELTLPTANLKANTRIALRYKCSDSESATWEVKNIEIW